jgi:hypothetical protein
LVRRNFDVVARQQPQREQHREQYDEDNDGDKQRFKAHRNISLRLEFQAGFGGLIKALREAEGAYE